jgi:hypothetical protein
MIQKIQNLDPNFKLEDDSNIWNIYPQSPDKTKFLSNTLQSYALNQSKTDYISPYSFKKQDLNQKSVYDDDTLTVKIE